MRRFDYDENDEYRKEVDNFFGKGDDMDDFDPAGSGSLGLTPEEYKAIVEEERVIFERQFSIAQQELNHRVLQAAIRVCQASFWWRFNSIETRLKTIDTVYTRLKKLEEPNADV